MTVHSTSQDALEQMCFLNPGTHIEPHRHGNVIVSELHIGEDVWVAGVVKFDGTDTYPVGVLSRLQNIYRALTHPALAGRRWERVRYEVRVEWRYLGRQLRHRNWRAVRNSFNGYLAEHGGHPHNCGRGWTKRAAERRAERICRAAA